jgi:hypothetical protein
MAELTMTTPLPYRTTLSARAEAMARSVADVIELRGSTESGAGETAAFLRAWADGSRAAVESLTCPLDRLAARLRLTEHECDLIVLAGLPDEHEGIAATFRSIHPQGEPRPTVGLAALLSGGGRQDRSQLRDVLTGGEAVRRGILHPVGPGTFFELSLVLPARLWEVLHGHDAWPAELPRVALDRPPAGLDTWVAGEPVQAAIAAVRADRRAAVLITGDDEAVVLARCAALAAAAGRDVIGARMASGDRAGLSLLAAHAAARGAVPMIVVSSSGGPVEPLSIGDIAGAALVCAPPGRVQAAPDRAVLVLPAGPVATADQRLAWMQAVPGLASQAPALAARHPLDPAITAQLGADVRAQPGELAPADVSRLIRSRAAASLPTGAQLLTPDVPWSHLVLPDESGRQLHDAVTRLDHQDVVLDDWGLRHRAHASRGTRLLLTGPPGTGKSLAAAAVATAAQTDLLVVDVSRVVSKWLGETEKNLAAAFECAERTQAVLLLDEADALFGTRTEISDANDRYANLETAYLLQRLDRFEGMVVLTTNLRANIDAAFIRRMDFVVDFPIPDEPGRTELWARHLPLTAMAADMDTDALAQLYPVPGAWIRNAAVAAAYDAAATGGPITQQQLVAAMRREYAKSSQPFPGEPPRRRHVSV